MQSSLGTPPEGHARIWRDIFFTARDGLRLHARHYPSAGSARRAVVCLPGLTRNARDFHDLAAFLSASAQPTARDVYALDYRGRGQSAHDPDWNNYTLQVELLDVLDFMTVTGLGRSGIIGTSRGGLIAMLMAAMRPSVLGAVVLNDIGPVIEQEGLARILAYTGRVPLPATWNEAAQVAYQMNKQQFPAVPREEWADIARQWFDDVNGQPAHSYDRNLGKAMTRLDGPVPTLWPQFEALANVPILAIRGELSDLLAQRTLDEMRVRHARLETLIIRGQGHAPLLREPATHAAIGAFLAAADDEPRETAAMTAVGAVAAS